MTRTRYLELVAGTALASGVPLHEALTTALAHLGKASPAESRAVVDAREGRLHAALGGLGIDPLVSAAASVAPESAAEVSRRLRALPPSQWLLAPLWNWTVYLVTVFAVTAGAAAASSRVLAPLARDFGLHLDVPLAPSCGVAVLVTLAAFALLQRATAKRLHHVRLSAAAAVLTTAAGEGMLPAFLKATRATEGALERLWSGGSARTHDELAHALLQQLESDVARVARAWRTVGSLVAAVLAGSVATQVYSVISRLGGGLP